MLVAQSVFSGILAAFAVLSYFFVYRRMVSLQADQRRALYDPDLMVIESWKPNEQSGDVLWDGDLYLCNPSPSPIVITDWRSNEDVGGKPHIYVAHDAMDGDLFFPLKTVIDGYSSHHIMVPVLAKGDRRVEIVIEYSTGLQKNKTHTIVLGPAIKRS